MTPAHCNCLYFNERKRTCHNPDAPYYHERYDEELSLARLDSCRCWEHWREFIDEEKRRLKHGKTIQCRTAKG